MITQHADITGGTISNRRFASVDVPPHKKHVSLAVHDCEKPQFDAWTHTCTRVETIIPGDRIQVSWNVEPRPVDEFRATAQEMLANMASGRVESMRTPGMDTVYDMQRQEMLDYLAAKSAGQATPSASYPLMTALVGLQGADLDAVAETIRQRVTAEASRIATINAARLSAKANIAGSGSVEQIASIVASARAAIEAA